MERKGEEMGREEICLSSFPLCLQFLILSPFPGRLPASLPQVVTACEAPALPTQMPQFSSMALSPSYFCHKSIHANGLYIANFIRACYISKHFPSKIFGEIYTYGITFVLILPNV